MALQNIGAAHSGDAFYRYKMPKMVTKIVGKGNGVKTNVANMAGIAKALGRPPSYTTKYFGCELGAQSKFDEKTGAALVNGAHDTAKLAGLLEKFIRKYVQCYGCGNPETAVVVTKTQMLALKCAACGFLSAVDMRDKLATFIVKNPPQQKKPSKDTQKKDRKKENVGAKASWTEKKGAAADVQWQTDTSLEAARRRVQEQLSAATAGMVMLSTADDPIREFLRKGSPPSQVRALLGSLPGTRQEAADALLEALFEGAGKGFAGEAARRRGCLAALGGESQALLLGALEAFCGKAGAEAAAREAALVLKDLYDGDVIEEESVLQWYRQGLAGRNRGSPVWNNVKPFVEWLQSAESESEED